MPPYILTRSPVKNSLLLYGANGYSAKLIITRLKKLGFSPVLAGRNHASIVEVAREFNLDHRVFDLKDPEVLRQELKPYKALINAAGPFSKTAKPLLSACIQSKCHYFDITGEVDVFEMVASRDAELKQENIMAMPGVGFDVVPSDCLAVYLKEKLPSATDLTLAFSAGGNASPGTLKTIIEQLGSGCAVRQGGRIVYEAMGGEALDLRHLKMGMTTPVSWGDVSTAYHSTSIPNIRVYMRAPSSQRVGAQLIGAMGWFFRRPRVIASLQHAIGRFASGPDLARRQSSRSYFWGRVREGSTVYEAMLETPNGYDLTAECTAQIINRCIGSREDWRSGFHTPGSLFGSGFIESIEGVKPIRDLTS